MGAPTIMASGAPTSYASSFNANSERSSTHIRTMRIIGLLQLQQLMPSPSATMLLQNAKGRCQHVAARVVPRKGNRRMTEYVTRA